MKIYSEDGQRAFGKTLATLLKGGEVIALEGDLGAGKTTLTQGIAQGLGIKEWITSPTFTLLETYMSGRLPLCHIDAYRVEDVEHLQMVGFDDALDGTTVVVVEWAERILALLPPDYTKITITKEENARGIVWQDYGHACLAERLNAICS